MATATGIHHRTYRAELALRHTRAEWARLGLVLALLVALPWLLNVYWLGIANTVLIAVIGAVVAAGYRRTPDSFSRRHTRRVVGQFVPCLFAGAAVSLGFAALGRVSVVDNVVGSFG